MMISDSQLFENISDRHTFLTSPCNKTMLQDVLHPPTPTPLSPSPPPPPPPLQAEQLAIEEASSPLSVQIYELCDPELFPETLQNSEVTSSSTCCYEDNSSYVTNVSLDNNLNSNSTTATTSTTATSTTTATNNNNNTNFSIIFDTQEEIDNDISASVDFSPSSTFSVTPFFTSQQVQGQYDFSSVQPQVPIALGSLVEGLSQYATDSVPPLMGAPPLTSVFEEDCLSSVPSFVPLNPSSSSCSFLSTGMGAYIPHGSFTNALTADNRGIFGGSILLGSELQPQELEYQEDNGGTYYPDSMQRVFNPQDFKALNNESQQLIHGAANSNPLTPEISNLEDSSFKVGKLSVEQRKEKIHRYMKKRNERNFSKKIKYACRKTLADSRPRVRGRFAKNDDFGETLRPASSNHTEDDEEVVVKEEEEDMVDSSDIFAHISGVNSFKCTYPIQSWM